VASPGASAGLRQRSPVRLFCSMSRFRPRVVALVFDNRNVAGAATPNSVSGQSPAHAVWFVGTLMVAACSSQAPEPERQSVVKERSSDTAQASTEFPPSAGASVLGPQSSAALPELRANTQYQDREWGFALSLSPRWTVQIEPYPNGRAVVAKDLNRFVEVVAFPADAKTDSDKAITDVILRVAKARGVSVPPVDPIALPQPFQGSDGRQFTFTISAADRLDAISVRAVRVRYILVAYGIGAFSEGRAGVKLLGS
jgi:hypothetical protein